MLEEAPTGAGRHVQRMYRTKTFSMTTSNYIWFCALVDLYRSLERRKRSDRVALWDFRAP